jgi:predicted Zn-dependent protease
MSPTYFNSRMNIRHLAIALIVGAILAGCASSLNPISGRKSYGFAWSPSEEIQIGREADGSIVAQYGLYDNEITARYVDSLGQALASVSHFSRGDVSPIWANMDFYFRVLDSPVVNAFALPGGYVYVTRGLLAYLENEAQLAVVLGHEIGHVVGRHGSKATRKQQFGMGALILGALGSQAVFGGNAAENVLDMGSQATQLLFLKYGRDAETEADQLGVEYAAMSNYDAAQASAFFGSLKRMAEESGQSLPSLLSSHPDPGDREEYIRQRAARYTADYAMNKVRQGSLLRHVEGLVYGEDPRQGYVDNGMFHHPQMKFSFPVPNGFTTINQPTRVVMVPQNQEVILYLEVDYKSKTAREAAETFVAQEGLTVVESGMGQSAGFSARYVIADGTDDKGNVLRVRVHYIDFDEVVFSFTGLSSKAAYSSYSADFVNTMQGFRRETNAAILNKQPNRVAVLKAPNTARFDELVRSYLNVSGVDLMTLAILNQVDTSQQIPQSTAFKVVQ